MIRTSVSGGAAMSQQTHALQCPHCNSDRLVCAESRTKTGKTIKANSTGTLPQWFIAGSASSVRRTSRNGLNKSPSPGRPYEGR